MLSSLYIEFQNIERGVLNVELHRLCRATTDGGGSAAGDFQFNTIILFFLQLFQDLIQFHKKYIQRQGKKST